MIGHSAPATSAHAPATFSHAPATFAHAPAAEPRHTGIDAYRVLEQIGEGGWATVHRVVHRRTGREYAMKRARVDGPATREEMGQLLLNEAQIALRAHHASVVEIVDIGVDVLGRPCLVMELLRGEPLLDVVADGCVMDPETTLQICRQIAEALRAVHRSGAVHCDISPGNVYLEDSPDGIRAKLIDFGCAIAQDTGRRLPSALAGMISGTPHYVAPEQARGEPMDARSDIYSLGVILFELLAGAPPFEGDTVPALLFQHVHEAPPEPYCPYGPLPRQLRDTILRCLAKSPSARFQTAQELIDALDAVDWNEQSVRRCA